MKIVFMGTPEFAENILRALAANHDVSAVITQGDKPKGRGHKLAPPPVKMAAEELGITVFQPKSLKNKAFSDEIRQISADVFVIAAFGRILPQNILDMPKFGSINVHASLLPMYRGASPIQQAIADGVGESGVTIMRMDAGIDTGDIILQKTIKIDDDDNAATLSAKLSNLGAKTLIDALALIECGKAEFKPQVGETSYAPIIKKEDAKIDWKKSAKEIVCLVRAMNPSPAAFCDCERVGRLKIYKAHVFDGAEQCLPGEAAAIVKNGGILVGAGQGAVLLTEVQGENGKIMSACDFARGHNIKQGSRFL